MIVIDGSNGNHVPIGWLVRACSAADVDDGVGVTERMPHGVGDAGIWIADFGIRIRLCRRVRPLLSAHMTAGRFDHLFRARRLPKATRADSSHPVDLRSWQDSPTNAEILPRSRTSSTPQTNGDGPATFWRNAETGCLAEAGVERKEPADRDGPCVGLETRQMTAPDAAGDLAAHPCKVPAGP